MTSRRVSRAQRTGRALQRFWLSDRGLSAFLLFLFVTIFVVYPLAETGTAAAVLIDVATGLLLVSGVAAVWQNRVVAVAAGGIAAGDVVARIARSQVDGPWIVALECVLALVSLTLLDLVVLHRTFRPGEVTLHRLQGAIAAYLLIGLVFSYAYRLVVVFVPDAFHRTPDAYFAGHHAPWLLYFSFATLSTTGFGDIIPVHPVVRTIAMGESLIGLLFPATLIGRIVAMELESRRARRQHDD